MTAPALVCCVKGAESAEVRQVVESLLAMVRTEVPEALVTCAYVDSEGPSLPEVLAGLPGDASPAAIVVPLILAGADEVAQHISTTLSGRADVLVAQEIGSDPRVIAVVKQRLAEARVPAEATLVLAAVASDDPRAVADTAAVAEALRSVWEGPVRTAYAGGSPSVADATADARKYGEEGTVAVVAFMLAPGIAYASLAQAGADAVTAPLAPHPALAAIIVDRYLALEKAKV